MILDKELIFSKNQAVTDLGAAASTDVVDLTKPGDAIDSLWLQVLCTETATSTGDATVAIALETSDTEAFTSADTLVATAALAKTAIVAGTALLTARLPMGCKRYLRMSYTVGTAALTKGKFTAFLVSGIDKPE
ncbi:MULTISPECIES: Bbp16 family capsid cement protein [Aminobacterium]|jgi:hypothetical protein|uniref:Bbp16 family capsid cement protein n=1 Tax=Aminobacterium TaxID=81466 RepID=UPI00257FEF6F|nr:hypothetical protein [Aminobacterium sp. UBA4987]